MKLSIGWLVVAWRLASAGRHLTIPSLLWLLALPAWAVETQTVELTCPVGGEQFAATVVTAQSRTGLMLDFKPFGDVIAPVPLAVCPSNGLVMYKPEFSAAEVDELNVLITSAKYQALRAEHTTYHLLARTFEHMRRDRLQVAFMHLQSTWEVEDDPARYREYAGHAERAFERYTETANPSLREFVTAHIILAELARRTGRFEAAAQWLDRIKAHDESEKPYASRVILLLYDLIGKRSSDPHAMP